MAENTDPLVWKKKVLDAIEIKLGYSSEGDEQVETYQKVLDFSTKVAGVANPTYPKSMASVDKIVNWINNNG